MSAAGDGEPNGYFDATAVAKSLAPDQVRHLPDVIDRSKAAVAPIRADVAALSALQGQLLRIGPRVSPSSSVEQAKAWAASLVASLAHYPADLLMKAADAAAIKQFQFLNEVGPFIEEHLREPMARRRRVLNRLSEIELRARSLPRAEPWKPRPGDIEAIYAEVKFNPASLRA